MRLTISPRPLEADADDFYPDSDGRPVGETPGHFRNASYLKEMLDVWFADDAQVFVAVNMFVYYMPGNRLKHVSPDLFVVRGVPKDKPRRKYLLWQEGKGPDLAVELTSESTRDEDLDKKWLYRDILGVREYVLFDPYAEYLHPALQGFLLQEGDDVPMPMVSGRLVSEVLGLHLEADGEQLRPYDPASARRLRTPPEERAFAAEMAAKLDRATADKARLEQELAELRRRLAGMGGSERRQE
jgi:Uma2 family endonuclease